MQNIRTLIFSHFRLKVMALVIALVIWLVSTGRDYTTSNPTVELTIEPPQKGWILAVTGPETLKQTSVDSRVKIVSYTVELYGPQNKIEGFTGTLNARYSFADYRVDDIPASPPGQVKTEKLDLKSIKIQGLPPGIEVRKVEPEFVEVKLDKMITTQLTVQSKLVFFDKDGQAKPVKGSSDGCVEGFQIIDAVPSPPRVFVRGPQSVVGAMSKVDTEAAYVGSLTAGRTRKEVGAVSAVEDTPYGRVPIQCKDTITINIDVDELAKTRVIKDVPIGILTPVQSLYIVALTAIDGQERRTVDIEVKGAGTSIEKLRPDDPGVRAILDLMDVKPGIGLEKALTVTLPEGVRLAGKTPVAKYDVKPTERVEE